MRSRPGIVRAVLLLIFALASLSGAAEARNILELAREWDVLLEWDVLSRTAVIVKSGDRISLAVGSPWLVLNHKTRYPLDPPVERQGAVLLSEAAVTRIQDLLDERARVAQRWRIAAIVIDPGHGGKDPGSVDTYHSKTDNFTIQEKDVVLAVSLFLAELLRAEFPDRRVILTRSDDRWVSLEARPEMANAIELGRNEAIIYVSVHANRAFNTKARGYEIWVHPPEKRRTVLEETLATDELRDIWPILNSMREDELNFESEALARLILDEMESEMDSETENRGLKEESWAVVRNALMPAVLVEVGFVSNLEEARKLVTEAYQKRLANAIFRGIRGFVWKFEAAMNFMD